MSPGTHRLTPDAARDIDDILRHTLQRFGPRQERAYAALLQRAIDMIATQPLRPASRDRAELAADVRSFHLRHAARRRGAAAHLLFYRAAPTDPRIVILRVLHEAMDPARHMDDTPG